MRPMTTGTSRLTPIEATPDRQSIRFCKPSSPEDERYIRRCLSLVTRFGYHETVEGWVEAIEDGSVTPIIFQQLERRRGFSLVSIWSAGRHDRSLYVAALYGEPDGTSAERRDVIRLLDEVARLNDCSRVTFNSTRKEWQQAARRYGFRRSPYTTYERIVSKEVSDGR